MSHKKKVFLGLAVKPSKKINLNFKCTDILETFEVCMFIPEQYFFLVNLLGSVFWWGGGLLLYGTLGRKEV